MPKSDGLRLRIVQFSGKSLMTVHLNNFPLAPQVLPGGDFAWTALVAQIACFQWRNRIGEASALILVGDEDLLPRLDLGVNRALMSRLGFCLRLDRWPKESLLAS